MSYHIYTTEGIILKRQAFGEANILLYVLTKDLGLIMGSARSSRLSVSKLRGALQEYSLVTISCIKGKNGWKITNVAENKNFFFDYPVYTRKVLAQVTFLLLKMIQGESPNHELFSTVKSGFEFLKKVDEKYISSFEILLVIRLLYELGYVANSGLVESYLKTIEVWEVSLLNRVSGEREKLIEIINKSLKESHL